MTGASGSGSSRPGRRDKITRQPEDFGTLAPNNDSPVFDNEKNASAQEIVPMPITSHTDGGSSEPGERDDHISWLRDTPAVNEQRPQIYSPSNRAQIPSDRLITRYEGGIAFAALIVGTFGPGLLLHWTISLVFGILFAAFAWSATGRRRRSLAKHLQGMDTK